MNRSAFTRVLAFVLCAVMVMGMLPVLAFAADDFSLTIASTKTSALAPGVQEQEVVAYDANGDRIVYYAITANVATNSDVQVKANYQNNDNTGNWGKATVIEQANAATEKRGYNVVATTNAAYYNVSTGQPTGAFFMEGVNINGNAMGDQKPFFAILKDGTAMIGKQGTFSQYADQVQEAVGGWTMLVWDGEIVNNGTSKYPRSTVGVKANGDVVLMVADGNQKPYSAGLTYREQAEVMLNLGCVAAVELDGGGSATYAAKLEGTDELVIRNSCCDGTVRSVSNTLMVISTAVADGTFDHANLATDYVFYAPHSKVQINATGADKSGYPAEIPEGAGWVLSDDSFGTVANGEFVSNGKLGTVTVSMTVDGKIVGSTDVTVVNATSIAFGAEEKMIPYGKPSDFTVTALYNGADMYTSPDAYNFVCTAGSMNGFIYTAPEEGAGATATVTATYKYDSSVASDSIAVSFGKGSDILFNFEGGEEDAKYWGDYFDMVEAEKNGEYTNGYSPIYETANGIGSNKVEQGIHENVFLATKENGHVYSGDYSLAYTVDYRYSTAHANWQYAYLYYWGDPITLLDTEKGIAGTRLGMWMYIPEEAVGSCARFAYTYKTATGALSTAYLYFTYMYVEKGFSKLTSEKIPEAGWAYVYVDMKQISNTYVSTSYYKDENGNLTRAAESNYAPAFIQFIVSSSATGAEKVTFYIDDITLDYSDAVDDRDMPIISDPLILEDQDSFAIDGRTLNYNTITVTASAAEDTSRGTNFTGLNEATAQVYIDGHKVSTKFAAGKISATGIKLPNGTHDITFEIADKQGNYTKLTRQIVIAAESEAPTVTLTGVPVGVKTDGKLYTGGQYNMLLNTDKVEGIDSVNFKLWLNSASEWALDEMMVLDGFKVEYVLDENSCTADITVTRVDSDATGAATLVTIPVYAWSWNEELGGHDASTQWNSKGCAPQITVSYKVKYGNVEYTEEYDVDVAGFSNVRVDAKTELDSSIANLKKTIGEWHYHTAASVTDVANTCTTNGYTGRTVCSTCNSILNWGTTYATGHDYELTDGVLACACGEKFNGEKDGATYIDGIAYVNGWYNDTYYFVNGQKVTGAIVLDRQVYVFGDDGVYQPDAMYTGFIDTAEGKMYFLTNTDYVEEFVYISAVPHYFENGYVRNCEIEINGETCQFVDGKFVGCTTADVYSAGWAGSECFFIHYKDGRIVFTGEGAMFYHQSNSTVPWANEKFNITSVYVGKDITDICRFAFAHAYYITKIEIEEGSVLEKIGYSAFHYVNKIKTLVLPDTVTTLEWRAFSYMTSLESIYLPDNMQSMHAMAFDHHSSKLVLQVAEGTYAHEYAKQYGFLTELREKAPVLLGSGNTGDLSWTLYDTGVLTISGNGAMPNYNFNKNSANAAPWAKLSNYIEKIVIESGVTSVGEFAFYQCTNLSEVEFAANSSLTTIGKGAFGYSKALETITIPASVTTIASHAFYFSDGLKTVNFEDDSALVSIGDYAFRACPVLETVYIPEFVEKLGASLLYQSNNAVLQVADGTYAYKYANTYGYAVEVRPHTPRVTHSGTCGENATWELYEDGKLVISGFGAIPNYSYLVNVSNSAPWASLRNKVTSIVIGKDITAIGEFNFYSMTKLTSVTFEAGSKLTTIGKGAFGYSDVLETITIPATVKTIASHAFYFSDGLKTVSFEDDSVLVSIGDYAFRGCPVLETVYIPEFVTKLGASLLYQSNNAVLQVAEGTYAQKYADSYKYPVELRPHTPVVLSSGTCGENATWAYYEDGKLVISGSGAIADYSYLANVANSAPWASLRGKITTIVIGKDITSIGEFNFYSMTALTSVVFEEGSKLETIGKGAFGYSKVLETVTIPASVKTISAYAFYFSSALKTVNFEAGSQLTTIGDYAFRNCTALTNVYIPNGVSSIGASVFYACGQVNANVVNNSYAHRYMSKYGYAVTTR